MARRGQFQSRIMLAPVLSRMSLVCGTMLVVLGFISLMTGPLLDLDHSSRHSGSLSVSIPPPSETAEPTERVHQVSANVSDGRDILPDNIWASKLAELYYGCSSPSNSFPRRLSEFQSNGYILIETSGGLNQQRIGITDAVVAARILNATLVVPQLDHASFWKDNSNFSDIFDVDWFIAALAPDVVIVKELPARLKITQEKLYSTRVPRKCEPEYYVSTVLPLLRRKKAIRLTKFDYRLATNLEEDLQKLRCRVNYNSLRFTTAITNMGEALVKRLKKRSRRYIALHLRFEPDMLAFSGCYYGGGEKELRELGSIRKRWNTLSPIKSDKEHRSGKCPLTPEEVGLMLRALGFGSDSHIYVASGEVYGGEETLAPLKALFPNFYNKDSLASKEELQPFSSYSSRMAAIDYIVCDESDVFITNNNGNMARILAGSRRYFGHRRTIQPNVKKLGSIFPSRLNITWDSFASKLRTAQTGFMGEPNEMRPGREEFFEFPAACICHKLKEKDILEDAQQQQSKENHYGQDNTQQILEIDNEPEDGDEMDHEGAGLVFEEENNLLTQQADLEKEANALVQTEDMEMLDLPWLSD